MGISRDGENNMELFEDHIYFEILEKAVRITNLHNFTMPLIRYEMNDVLIPVEKSTASPFLQVQSGVGRPEGIPYFTSSENDKITIHPIEFDPLMPEGVKSFAMICEKPNCVEYSIFIDENFKNKVESVKAEALKVIKEFFAEKGLAHIQVEVVVAKDYKVNPNSLKTQLWKNAAYQEEK